MKSKNRFHVRAVILAVTFAELFALLATACFGQSGGVSINSADDLKKYLDSQPANSLDKPIRVKMSVNSLMLENVVKALNSAGKYVSLDLSGSPLKEIDDFQDCKSLTGIIIPNGVTTIGEGAFYGCTGLTSVTIPSSVTDIGAGAFYGCKSLTSVTIPDSADIGDAVFYGCANLTSVTIGKGVTYIEEEAFYGCASLTSITIPSNITGIGEDAFRGCTSLTSVTFQGKIPSREFDDDAFRGLGDLRTKYLASGIGTYNRSGSTWAK